MVAKIFSNIKNQKIDLFNSYLANCSCQRTLSFIEITTLTYRSIYEDYHYVTKQT